MSLKKNRLRLCLTLVVIGWVLLAAYHGKGEAGAPKSRMRVLRARHELALKPKAHEVAAFQRGDQERTFKTKEFKDMPLVVTEVRNLQSDTWYNDLEVEVKNVSTKPIYFIIAYLFFPDVPSPSGTRSGVTLVFGDPKNRVVSRTADPQEDPHINPGEKIILRILEQYKKGLNTRQERWPETVKRFEFHFGHINFGDGTAIVAERPWDSRLKRSHSNKQNHSSKSGKEFVCP